MLNRGQKKIAIAYFVLQVIIWIKSALFFLWFGYGKSMPFSLTAFSQQALAFDFFFHNGMHVTIGVLALLFGRSLGKKQIAKLPLIVVAAVALHNVGYWFTASHPGIEYSLVDFARDSVILAAFVFAGFVFATVWTRHKASQQKN